MLNSLESQCKGSNLVCNVVQRHQLCVFFHAGSSNARPTIPDIRCPVKGPMIVIRSRPDGMGEKVVYILKQYLEYTQTQGKQWQQQHGQTVTPWQMFEVIGDFGESDQTEVLAKLSAWAKAR